MSGITDPTEEYFKNGLWAWVTDQWKKLIGDAAGHLQVDVVESGLPTGAATSANQTTMITALQLIDDLRAALSTVATDSLDVRLDGQTADVEVKQQTAADLVAGAHGWDGSAWRKLPLVFGYSGRVAEQKSDLTAGAGQNDLDSTAVPAGYVYVLQVCSMFNVNSVSDHEIGVTDGSIFARMEKVGAVAAAGLTHLANGHVVLAAGDKVRCRFGNCTAGDDLYAQFWFYTMKVAE